METTEKLPERLKLPQVKAAKALGVTDRTIRNWTKAKRLNPVRCGGVLLYPIEELEQIKGWQPRVANRKASGR
jgi:hypothetical protein